MELINKVCVVTGGASGIGKATSELFYSEGAHVVVADIDFDSAHLLSTNLGSRALAVRVDVSNSKSIIEAVGQILKKFGRVDVLINNAGFGFTGTVVTIDENDWDRLMSVNLKGVYLCSKYFIPVMSKNGQGVIVNTTSYTASAAIRNRAAYVASKGGVSSLTRAMALDHASEGIRINAVAPGTIQSPYFEKIFSESSDPDNLKEQFSQRAAMERMGSPEEVAQAILWLASEKSSFATGSVLTVDGGSSIGNHLVD